MRLAVIIVLVVGSASLARARGGVLFVPPIEVDIGTGVPVGDSAAVTGATTETLIGLHWASLAWMATPIELGVGYIEHSQVTREPGVRARDDADRRAPPPVRWLLHARLRRWSSTAIGGRGSPREANALRARMPDREFSTRGGAVRLATELFATVHGAAGHGGAGRRASSARSRSAFYVEAARRQLPQELGATEVTAGLTFRLPFIAIAGGSDVR